MKRTIALVIVAMLVMALLPAVVLGDAPVWDGSVATDFAGGDGTAESPYEIANGAQLALLAQNVRNKVSDYSGEYFVVTADIALNDTTDYDSWGQYLSDGMTMIAPANNWTPIGYNTGDVQTQGDNNPFKGIFDGQGHTISGLYAAGEENFLALFGFTQYANIENITLDKAFAQGKAYTALLVGYVNTAGLVRNAHVSGKVGGTQYCGGLAAYSVGRIENCTADVQLAASNFIGLLAGYIVNGQVTDCSTTGMILGTRWVSALVGYGFGGYVSGSTSSGTVIVADSEGGSQQQSDYSGGIMGYGLDAHITNCEFTGSVSGTNCAGIIGTNTGGSVKNSINRGRVQASAAAGGIVGYHNGGVVMNCANYGDVSGRFAGGIAGTTYLGGVFDCISIANITGGDTSGGIVGSNGSKIANCAAAGSVTAAGSGYGGILGANSYSATSITGTSNSTGSVMDCFYQNDMCSGGQAFGTPCSAEQMKRQDNYRNWDFKSVWSIEEGSYPLPCSHLTTKAQGVALWDGGIASGFAGGSGTQADPYIIKTAGQLAYLAQQVNAGTAYEGEYFILNNDIRLNDTSVKNWTTGAVSWTPIGLNNDCSFKGIFDGAGHCVSGIYIDRVFFRTGLFGCITSGAMLADISVADSYISGTTYTGGVVGSTFVGTRDESEGIVGCNFYNCDSSATVRGSTYTGGILGYGGTDVLDGCDNTGVVLGGNGTGGIAGAGYFTARVARCHNDGIIYGVTNTGGIVGSSAYACQTFECINRGSVYGHRYTGGVVGYITTAIVERCYNSAVVNGSEFVGGVVGQSQNATCENCFNTGTVSGTNSVAGIIGVNYTYYVSGEGNARSDVRLCYNVGTVECGGTSVAGICASNQSGYWMSTVTVENCYWLEGCGSKVGAINAGGLGTETINNVLELTDDAMQKQDSYAGFDFTDVWVMGTGDYPYPVFKQLPAPSVETADYTVKHWQEQLDGNYSLFDSENLSAAVGRSVTASPQSYTGFSYDASNSDANGLVTEDGSLVLNLYYKRNSYTLSFVADGEVCNEYRVKYGSKFENVPAVPAKEGYDIVAPYWDVDAEAFDFIAGDMTINAVYTINTYCVRFYVLGTLYEEHHVDHGEALMTVPAVPEREGYTQTPPHWDVTDFSSITSDMDVHAVYAINVYTVTLPAGNALYSVSAPVENSVEYGQSFSFHVTTASGEEPTVRVNGELLTGKPVEGTAKRYSYNIEYVAEDMLVTVSVAGDSYEVVLPTGEGYAMAFAEGSGSPTAGGQSCAFTLTLLEGYDRSTPTVYANNEIITAENGVYTIPAVNEVVYISVTGVVLNEYSVKFYVEGELEASFTVKHGEALTTVPAVPEKAYYSGAWDVTDFDCITDDLVVNAVYTLLVVYGDANCDGVVAAADAAAILRYLVDLDVLTPQGLINGDCDGKPGVSAADAAAILRYLVELEPTLPVAK